MSDSNPQVVAEGVPLTLLHKRELKPLPELVVLTQPRSVHAEKFRRLKTTLVHRCGKEAKVIVVTSSVPGEGKSTVSANLSLAFAGEGGDKVLLVDADLRRPSIGRMIEPAPQLGLTEVLTRQADLPHALLHLTNTPLDILPAGSKTANPLELFATGEARDLLNGLRDRYDRIIIDTPPIAPFTDADALGGMSDGMIMVVRAGVTPTSVVREGLAAVTSTRILGTVLNAAEVTLADRRSYYDGYYRSYYEKDEA